MAAQNRAAIAEIDGQIAAEKKRDDGKSKQSVQKSLQWRKRKSS